MVAAETTEKLQQLYRACAEWVGNQGEQLIIFTEFKDTLTILWRSWSVEAIPRHRFTAGWRCA